VTRNHSDTKRAVPAETQREILLAPPIVIMRLLNMASVFRRNSDNRQVFQDGKYKKRSFPSQKCKKASFFILQRICCIGN